jgi:hypothetical protein
MATIMKTGLQTQVCVEDLRQHALSTLRRPKSDKPEALRYELPEIGRPTLNELRYLPDEGKYHRSGFFQPDKVF